MAIIPAADLFKSISSFEIDEGKPALSFTRRLARENGWTVQYAERVVQEYKRFVYLACTANHAVTPSDAVDQAWHLHLTYTRSYWDRFCAQVLKRPLHHEPTRGGDEEGVKYADQYERTLATYIAAFRATPPDDIWPSAAMRFGDEADAVRVAKSRYLILPRPSAAAAVAGIIVMLVITWIVARWQSKPAAVARSSQVSVVLGVGAVVVLVMIMLIVRKGGRGGGGCSAAGCGGGCGSGCGAGCGGGCGGG